MFTNRLTYMLIIVVLLVVTACAPPFEATPPAPGVVSTPFITSTPLPPTLTATSTPLPTSTAVPWKLVVIGDSIPFNSEEDCPGCTSFVDRYASAISQTTGHPVEVQNLSKHTGLQIDGLLRLLENNKGMRNALANADIILVGIAHNDAAMNSNEDPCDGPNDDNPDWSKYKETCAVAAAEMFRPKFESVYAQVAALRAGKPTIFRTINRYNDWIGWPGHDLPSEGITATKEVIDAWNDMICKAAEGNGFICADIYQAFNGPDGLTPSGNLLAADYTHPSDKGNEVIAQVLIDLGYAPLGQTSELPAQADPFAGEDAWIAVQSNRGGSEGIWLVHPDGTELHQVATDVTGEQKYGTWSPDGTKLVFTTRGGETEPLYEYDLATNTSHQLFLCEDPCVGDDEPVYSPDGTKVAFIRALAPFVNSEAFGGEVPSDCGLWIGNIATGEVMQITSNPECDREYFPQWSPDGSQLTYWRDPYENGKPAGTAIFVINADGSDERQLTDPEMFAGDPHWSPDGQWIVFSTYPLNEFNFVPAVSNLYRIHPDGSGMEQLTHFENVRATIPRYTPNGEWILFTAVQPSSRSIWAMPAEGGEPIVLVPGGIFVHAVWQP